MTHIKNWSDFLVYIKLMKLKISSYSKWYLRLTKYKPSGFRVHGQFWSYSFEYHASRFVFSGKMDGNVIKWKRQKGSIEVGYQYTFKDPNGIYKVQLPSGITINADGVVSKKV